ncbi:hypothetical protein BURK2_00056 [Burkholderiales bacterium]|nr:hypothetical protein BURK2_00056 [Burkholderiales bacterium]
MSKRKAKSTSGIEAFIGCLAGKTEKVASLDEINAAGPIDLAEEGARQSRRAAGACGAAATSAKKVAKRG